MRTSSAILAIILIFWLNGLSHCGRSLRRPTSDDDPDDERPFHYYIQKVDHFIARDRFYFKQRYYVEDKYYVEGGPVFLFVNEEDPIDSSLLSRKYSWVLWAEKLHALCFVLEHRYYGESLPTKVTYQNLTFYLDVHQVLADIASFRNSMTEEHKLGHSKWILFGGSYGGNLVAWFRLKYPHLVDGVVSSSFTYNKDFTNSGYYDAANAALEAYNATCYKNFETAWDQFYQLLAEGEEGWADITSTFRLCGNLNGNIANDVYQTVDQLMSELSGLLQYANYYDPDSDVSRMCAIMSHSNMGSELDRFGILMRSILKGKKKEMLLSFLRCCGFVTNKNRFGP